MNVAFCISTFLKWKCIFEIYWGYFLFHSVPAIALAVIPQLQIIFLVCQFIFDMIFFPCNSYARIVCQGQSNTHLIDFVRGKKKQIWQKTRACSLEHTVLTAGPLKSSLRDSIRFSSPRLNSITFLAAEKMSNRESKNSVPNENLCLQSPPSFFFFP